MKTVIVYDSMYGNTEIIARAIGDAISGDIQVLRSNEANAAQLETVDFLIVGAPTQAGRPTPAIQEFLNTLTKSTVKGVNIASFDTRISAKWVGIFGTGSRVAFFFLQLTPKKIGSQNSSCHAKE